MSHNNTAFHQLLKPLSRHEFEGLAKQHHTGQKLRSATRWDQFIGMSMSQLSGRQSLRDIESNLEAQHEKLYHLGAKPIARSTLARLNENQPAELYQSVFYRLLHRCKKHPGGHKFRFKNPLYSLDASVIDLSLKLFPWAARRADTANVKLSVGLNHGNMLPEFVALSDGNESDMVQERKFKFPPTLRRVGYIDKNSGKKYVFLTNNFSLCAATIAAIYKDRWQVELFFKAIKQNLKIKAFVGLSKNAILTQIWIAMITYLLVAFVRHSAKAGWTVQRILRVLQLNLFERKSLLDILKPDPPRHKKSEPQMRFAL